MSSTLLQPSTGETQDENNYSHRRHDDWSETNQSHDTSSIVTSNNDFSKYGNLSYNSSNNDVSKYDRSSFNISNSDISQHNKSSHTALNYDIPKYGRPSFNVSSTDISQKDRSSFNISNTGTSKYSVTPFYASNNDISNPSMSVQCLEADWNTTLEEQQMILAKFEEESERSKKSASVIKRSKSVANANAPMISEIDSRPMLKHHHETLPIFNGETIITEQVG
jgi:hypothetical protein